MVASKQQLSNHSLMRSTGKQYADIVFSYFAHSHVPWLLRICFHRINSTAVPFEQPISRVSFRDDALYTDSML